MARKPRNTEPSPNLSEIGSSGLVTYGGQISEESLRKLAGTRGIKTFAEMRDNDDTIGAILFIIDKLLRNVDWMAEPADESPESKRMAEFLDSCTKDMEHSWGDMISEILSMLPFGWSTHEIVYKVRTGLETDNPSYYSEYDDGMIGWRKLPIRSQETLESWEFNESGDVISMSQMPPHGGIRKIPVEKLLLFKTQSYKNNPMGRALDPTTPIITPNGWKILDELQPGDKIFDESGKVRYVTDRADWEDRPCYKLVFNDGSSIIADENHQWISHSANDRYQGRSVQLRTTSEIANSIKTSMGTSNHSIPWALALDYPEQAHILDPYYVGLWLGDGTSLCSDISCHADDAEETRNELQKFGWKVEIKQNGDPNCNGRTLSVQNDKKWSTRNPQSLLRSLNLISNKHIPDSYLRGSISQRLALLAGLMDSDGTVDQYGCCSFSNTNMNLIAGVEELVRSLGCSAHSRIHKKANGVTHMKDAWEVNFKPIFVPFRLKRKIAKIKDMRHRQNHYIVSARPVRPRRTVCIEVDSPSHLFLAGESMIPTHNSILRNAYRPWFFKKRIEEVEGIGIERDLAGLPVAGVPAEILAGNATAEQKATLSAIKKLVTNIRRDEQEGVVFPLVYDESGNKLYTLDLLSTGGTRQFDAQPLTAKILTPLGWTTMGDIAVGDLVIDPLGHKSCVTGVFPKGVRPVYKVTFADGRTTEADANHKWVVTRSKWKNRNIENAHPLLPKYKIKKTHELIMNSGGTYQVPPILPVVYRPRRKMELDPYVLGVLLGDGYIKANGHSEFCSSDAEIANEVSNNLPSGDYLRPLKSQDSINLVTYRISGTEDGYHKGNVARTKDILFNLGLNGSKSATKFIPKEYLRASIEERIRLLQGLMDTDGTIDSSGFMSYGTISERLHTDILELIRSLGGNAGVHIRPMGDTMVPRRDGVAVKCESKSTYFWLKNIRLPEGIIPFRLKRKVERLRPFKCTMHNSITSVEYVGEKEVQCILVSSPSHMYITDDFIPTHNTNAIITRYSKAIAMTVLADFIFLGQTKVGSYALAQPYSSKVLTPNGYTTMGEIKKGDTIVCPLGYDSKVIDTFEHGVKDVYKLTFADDRSVLASADHKWVVTTSHWKRQGIPKRPRLPWAKVAPEPYPLYGYGVLTTQDLIDRMKDACGNSRFHVPRTQPVIFKESKPLPIDSYILGMILGDGYIPKDRSGGAGGAEIISGDFEIIEEMRRRLPEGHKLVLRRSDSKGLRFRISGPFGRGANDITKALDYLNLLGTNSFTKFIPDVCLRSSLEERIWLLRGLMDSDGGISPNGQARYSTVSVKLRDGIIDLIRGLGGVASTSLRRLVGYNHPTKGHYVEKETLIWIVECKLPHEINPFFLPRKAERVKNQIKYKTEATGIVNIERVESERVKCIAVSSPSHMYITDDYIPTHNSSDKTDMFSASLGAWLRSIADVFNKQAIPRLMKLNGIERKYWPTLVPSDIEKENVNEFCDNIYKLVGVGALMPDDSVDQRIRQLLSLAPAPTNTPVVPMDLIEQRLNNEKKALEAKTDKPEDDKTPKEDKPKVNRPNRKSNPGIAKK